MAATKFVPLTADLIDEGQFLSDLDQELAEVQQAISVFRKTYGEKAKDAKAKLTIEIEVKVENVDENFYSVKTTMKATPPKRPASVSIAMGGDDDNGKPSLFVRQSGSDDEHPKQLKLATRNGRVVDHETGIPLD